MTTSSTNTSSAGAAERPGTIDAIPVRHPGRTIASVIVGLLVLMLVHQLATNRGFDWPFTILAMRQTPVFMGFVIGTCLVTVLSMVLGVAGGVLLAVMRMSPNKLLSGVAFAYAWFFRSIPRYVLLMMMGALGYFFPNAQIGIGIPYDQQILHLFGLSGSLQPWHLDANRLFSGFFGAIIGLGMSEAAYMSEVARAGILSVDRGQLEAATALGMNRNQAMRRIVLPQAMRVIVPPMGNETIAMFKDTSLLSALPLTTELLWQLRLIGTNWYKMMPVYVAATLYYLITTTILMIGQSWLEKRFGRGHSPLSYTGSDH
ncbi:amino acid ABC transporter permease [Luteococcus sanguinis]|uniref:Amino acid ABC transporter permease n=1 Tax=Luteococcus sanguinis TaxID=174038 RepID=A0ABW1X301_9ACTN